MNIQLNPAASIDYTESIEEQYLNALATIKNEGALEDEDRTGTGTYGLAGIHLREEDSFSYGRIPVITTKKIHLPAVIHELLWMISGDTNVKYLQDNGVKIWNEWAAPEDVWEEGPRLSNYDRMTAYAKLVGRSAYEVKAEFTKIWNDDKCHKIMDEAGTPTHSQVLKVKKGDLGPIYGKQWRDWSGIDQLANAIETLRTNPASRRIIINAWNVGELDQMALTPCHAFFQFISKPMSVRERAEWCLKSGQRLDALKNVPNLQVFMADSEISVEGSEYLKVSAAMDEAGIPERKLHLVLTQRSADMFLGVPFNITSYSLLLYMVAQVTGHAAASFTHNIGDGHIYCNHEDAVDQQLYSNRKSLPFPRIWLNPEVQEIDDFKYEDIKFVGYTHHSAIKAPISV